MAGVFLEGLIEVAIDRQTGRTLAQSTALPLGQRASSCRVSIEFSRAGPGSNPLRCGGTGADRVHRHDCPRGSLLAIDRGKDGGFAWSGGRVRRIPPGCLVWAFSRCFFSEDNPRPSLDQRVVARLLEIAVEIVRQAALVCCDALAAFAAAASKFAAAAGQGRSVNHNRKRLVVALEGSLQPFQQKTADSSPGGRRRPCREQLARRPQYKRRLLMQTFS